MTSSFDDLSRIVGVVSQETYLLHASIRENLLYAKPDATDADLWRAARGARRSPTSSRPWRTGWTPSSARAGMRFSGGEKQRFAIARTLLRDPRVLVLDEATSALDNETERELQAALDEVSRGRTTITIAHRLSTIEQADQIAVLSHGHVVERGTHASLLAEGGRYARLAGEATHTPSLAVIGA